MNTRQQEMEWSDSGWIRRIYARIRCWISSRWNEEALRLLVALNFFLWSGPLLRRWDPTAGVLDIGILSMLPLVVLVVLVARLSAAGVYQWMVGSFNELTGWQQALGYGVLYLCYFWSVVWLMIALL